jgi:hypothetical protein
MEEIDLTPEAPVGAADRVEIVDLSLEALPPVITISEPRLELGVGIDLADQPAEVAQAQALSTPRATRFNPERMREGTRTVLALVILVPIPLSIVLAWIALWQKWSGTTEIENITIALLGTVTGLGGAILGFYFGEELGRRRGGQ